MNPIRKSQSNPMFFIPFAMLQNSIYKTFYDTSRSSSLPYHRMSVSSNTFLPEQLSFRSERVLHEQHRFQLELTQHIEQLQSLDVLLNDCRQHHQTRKVSALFYSLYPNLRPTLYSRSCLTLNGSTICPRYWTLPGKAWNHAWVPFKNWTTKRLLSGTRQVSIHLFVDEQLSKLW